MTPKAAVRYLLWYGSAVPAGYEPTEEDLKMFEDARDVSKLMAKLTMGLKPVHYAYTKGQSYKELLEAVK